MVLSLRSVTGEIGVVLIAIPMCCLLCQLLTLCCPLLTIVVEKIIYFEFGEMHKIQIFGYPSCRCR